MIGSRVAPRKDPLQDFVDASDGWIGSVHGTPQKPDADIDRCRCTRETLTILTNPPTCAVCRKPK